MTDILIAKRYLLVNKLGEGILGPVFLCDDIAVKQPVTIKIISSPLIEESNIFNNFYKTFRKLLDVNHELIIAPKDSGLTLYNGNNDEPRLEKNIPFIIFDYFKGKPLISGINTFKLELALAIFKQLLYAVDIYHQKELVHRSIKPGNVLIDDNNNLRLTHFGLYPLTDYQPISSYQDMSSAIYRAPELTEGDPGSYSSDFYSIGALLYHMLSGSFPFSGQSIKEILHQQTKNKLTSLCKVNPEVNKKLENMIFRLLDSKLENRFSSKEEIESALEEVFIKHKTVDYTISNVDNNKKTNPFIKRLELEKNISEKISPKSKNRILIVSAKAGYGKTSLVEQVMTKQLQKNKITSTHRCCYLTEYPFKSIKTLVYSLWEQNPTLSEAPIPWMISTLTGKRNFRTIESEMLSFFDEEQTNIKNELEKYISKSIDRETIFFIDSIQWIDENSLEILNNITRKNSLLKILAIHDNDYPFELLNKPEPEIEIYNLPELNMGESLELIKKLTDLKDVNEDIAKALYDKSNANIMYLNAATKYLLQSQKITTNKKITIHPADIAKLPETLEDMLTLRIQALPEKLKVIYKTASCIGVFFDLNTICSLTETMPDSLVQELLNETLDYGIHKIKNNLFYFENPQYQKIFNSYLPSQEKIEIHLKIADIYERQTLNNPYLNSDIIMVHYLQTNEQKNITAYTLKTAEKNTIFRLYQKASELYAQTIANIYGKPEMIREYWDCLHKQAMICLKLKKNTQAEEYLINASEIADKYSDTFAYQECMYYLSSIYANEQKWNKLESVINKALSKNTLRDNIWKSKLLAKRALTAQVNSYKNISFDDAISALKTALKISRELRDIDGVVESLELLAMLHCHQHIDSQSEVFLLNALGYRISKSKRLKILEKLTKLFLYPGNNMAKVKEYAEKGIISSNEYGMQKNSAVFYLLKAKGLLETGDVIQAKAALNSAIFDDSETSLVIMKAIILSELSIKCGKPKQAGEELKKAEKIITKTEDKHSICDFYIAKAQYQKETSLASSIKTYDKAIELAKENGYSEGLLTAMALQISACREMKDYDKAEQNIHRAMILKKYGHYSFTDGIIIFEQALIHRAKGNSPLALDLLDTSIKIFNTGDNVYEEGMACFEKANILKQIKMDYKKYLSRAKECFYLYGNNIMLEKIKA